MSLLSWFTRKPASAARSEPSGPHKYDATAPLNPQSRPARTPQESAGQEQANTRKNERMERRELLYTVVRDAMVRAGVLSASYKFKVLSLDQRGSQFLIMMDVAREFGGDTGRLSEIEALIGQTAKSRYDIAVTAVYWRVNDHVTVGIPLRGAASAPASAPATAASAVAAQQRPAGSPAPASTRDVPLMGLRPAASAAPMPGIPPAVRPLPTVFDPIEADEVAAFRKALGNAAAGRPASAPRAAPRPDAKRKPTADDFADTEMTSHSAPAPDLGATQYGDL